ncbi:MAG: hypothetical protein V3R95_05830 [Dehalococcoidia bacterium]
MADRRAGRIPHVRAPGGGLIPRTRNKDGRWRRKRSDAGHPRMVIVALRPRLQAAA